MPLFLIKQQSVGNKTYICKYGYSYLHIYPEKWLTTGKREHCEDLLHCC